MCAQLWPFLREYLDQLAYEDIGYVVDVYHVRPCDIGENKEVNDTQVLFLGYPTISVENKVNEIRKYAREQDWTEELTHQELGSIVKRLIEESQMLQIECLKYGLKFVDMGHNHTEILEVTLQELVVKVGQLR